MLSLEEMYEICPELKNLSEEEALEVRELLYELGELTLKHYIKKNNKRFMDEDLDSWK